MWCCSDAHVSVLAVIPAQAGIHCAVDLARHPGASRDPVPLLFASALIATLADKAFALRASHFSLLVQRKVTKRKHTPAACPTRVPRCGLATDAGIFGRHIHAPSENATHRARRPFGVLPASVAMPQGPRTNKSDSKIKIRSTPPQSPPALRAREKAESNSRLHRIRDLPFPGPRSPVPVSP